MSSGAGNANPGVLTPESSKIYQCIKNSTAELAFPTILLEMPTQEYYS